MKNLVIVITYMFVFFSNCKENRVQNKVEQNNILKKLENLQDNIEIILKMAIG